MVVHTPEGEKEPFGRQTLLAQKGILALPPCAVQPSWFTVANHECVKVSIRDADLEGAGGSSRAGGPSTALQPPGGKKVVYGEFWIRRIRRPMKLKVLPAGGLFEDYTITMVLPGGAKETLVLKVRGCLLENVTCPFRRACMHMKQL